VIVSALMADAGSSSSAPPPPQSAPPPQTSESLEANEFTEVLESETHVDMDKLLSLCRHGVPDRLRREAWKYLLGVSRPEKSDELSRRKRMGQEYLELVRAWQSNPQSELTRRIKGDISKEERARRTEGDFFCDPQTKQLLERLLRCYLHRQGAEFQFQTGMVHLVAPFVYVYQTAETDAFYCFQGLMKRLEPGLTFEGCKEQTVTFMTLLRHTLPELYQYLEEDQCAGGQWLTSWLQFLLARELPLPCVLRLWDTYFSLRHFSSQQASHPGVHTGVLPREASLQELHLFVCIAILEACHEDLMELDDAELLWYLQHLPTMDMGQLVMQAFNIRSDVISRSIL